MALGVIGWIVLGLIAGFMVNTLVDKRGEGLPFDVLLGILGAVLAGWLFNGAGAVGPAAFNIWSLVVAVIGAVVLLVIWHALRRSTRHA